MITADDPDQASLTVENLDPNGGALNVLGKVSVGPAGEFQVEGETDNVLTQGSVIASGLGVASDASIGGDLDVEGRATANSLSVRAPDLRFFASPFGVGVRDVTFLVGIPGQNQFSVDVTSGNVFAQGNLRVGSDPKNLK